MILEARDVVTGYGRVAVVHSVSLRVAEGQAVALIGPNGAGKSTLLKALARQVPCMSGKLAFKGEDYTRKDAVWAARSGIVLVPQVGSVFPDLTVMENLRLGAWLQANRDDLAAQAMERFPMLQERSQQAAGSLSGGERQILAISAALLMRPLVLLLDEPTSGLSPTATEAVVEAIDSFIADGTAVVWVVEQTPEPVLQRVSTAYLLRAGQLVFEGEGRSLLAEGRLQELFLE